MAGYKPLYIASNTTGLVEDRVEFILPNDAYPQLENAYIFRERILRKHGTQFLGRLRRVLTSQVIGNTDGSGNFSGNLIAILSLETDASFQLGSFSISDGTNTYTDNSAGILTGTPSGTGVINYASGAITITGGAPSSALTATFGYYPSLPVMGLRQRELAGINAEFLVAFDQVYAYQINGGQFQEFIPGTTWNGNDSDFFWTTNYWVDTNNIKIFWATNFNKQTGGGDPIRYTNGIAWEDFEPPLDGSGTPQRLEQCRALLPFRGRLLAFNTWEGTTLSGSVNQRQRIRWSAIGTPFYQATSLITTFNANAWRDDIRGQGGFLDIPTAEDIVSVGFVRDNLVIYCDRSTWQLRYTGRSIAPFQIEKVNTELGAESTFSAIQFDTSLVGIGDKGIVECDSYKSERIDIKIPDLVFEFNNQDNSTKRVYGIRDFQQRIAYWTFPYAPSQNVSKTFPNRRLVYNYENDSWAIFTDSFTCFGTYQPLTSLRWQDLPNTQWQEADFPWINRPGLFPALIGGNQEGFVHYLGSNLTPQVVNDPSLSISNIIGHDTTATELEVINHNLETGQIIQIVGIPQSNDFANLNGGIFMAATFDPDTLFLYKFNPANGQFNLPQVDDSTKTYLGGGLISVKDNFSIVSKKFNSLEEGQKIQMGYLDILVNNTREGAFTLKVYMNYNNSQPINVLPQNIIPATSQQDDFFNSVIPTNTVALEGIKSSKTFQRIFCPTRAQFLTLQYTLSNAQMVGGEQESDVQIDAQILWLRNAGRLI